jgi:hypothetical protein
VSRRAAVSVGCRVRRQRSPGDDAERFLENVRADELELAERHRLEPVELDA